jgi:hypothetical protein
MSSAAVLGEQLLQMYVHATYNSVVSQLDDDNSVGDVSFIDVETP